MKTLMKIINKLKYADYLLILYLLSNISFMVIYIGYNPDFILGVMLFPILTYLPLIAIRLLMIPKFVKKSQIFSIILNVLITAAFIWVSIYIFFYWTLMLYGTSYEQQEKIPYSEKVANYERTIKDYDGEKIFKYFPKKIPKEVNNLYFNTDDYYKYLKLYTNKEYIDKVIKENKKNIFWNDNANVICNNFEICQGINKIYDIDSMYILKGDEEYPEYFTGFSVSRKKDSITFFTTSHLSLNIDERCNTFAPSQNDYQYVMPYLLDEDRSYYYRLMPKSIPQNAQNYWFKYSTGRDGCIIVVRFNIDEQYINNIIRKNQSLLLPKEELSNQINNGIFLPNSYNYEDYIIYYLKKSKEYTRPTAGIIVSKKKDEIVFFMTGDDLLERGKG